LTEKYHFTTLDIGLAAGGALVLGGSLGELAGGIVLDAISNRERSEVEKWSPKYD